MRGTIEGITFDLNGDTVLSLRLQHGRQYLPSLQELTGKDLDIELKKHREKRSLDANAYMWVLLEKLSVCLKTTRDELYMHYIRTVGVSDILECREEAYPMLKASFKDTEVIDEWFTGETHILQIRCFYGTHLYDSEQFSRFLDEIIQDCKDQGIDTATPEEKARMIALWESRRSCK